MESACKRLRSNTIDPLEISPKSVSAASRLDGAVESTPVFKNQKRQRSDAMVDSSDAGMCAAEEDLPPTRRSSSCMSNPADNRAEHQQHEMFRPRAQYPTNFNTARIFDSQIGRTADQRAISIDWSRARTDSDASSSTASPMPTPLHTPRSYSVGNLSELPASFGGPSARRSIPGSLSSRSRSRTCSSEWVQVQAQVQGHGDSAYSAMSAEMERISLCAGPVPMMMQGSPRGAAGAQSLSPMPPPPAVFTPIQSMHKAPLLVLQSTAEEENEEEEEEESELVESFMHIAELSAMSGHSPCVLEDQGQGAAGGEGEDGRVTMPEIFLLPPSGEEGDGRLSTTDENSADAMMFAIEV